MGNLPSIQIYHPGFTPTERHPWHKQNPSRGCGPLSKRAAPPASPRPHQPASSSGRCRHGQIRRAADSRSTPSALQDWRPPSDRDSRPAARSGSASKPLLLSFQLQSCPSAAEPRSRAECETQTLTRQHAGERPPFHHGAGRWSRRCGAPDLFRVWCLSGFDQTSC